MSDAECRYCSAREGRPQPKIRDPKKAHVCAGCRMEPLHPKDGHYSQSEQKTGFLMNVLSRAKER